MQLYDIWLPLLISILILFIMYVRYGIRDPLFGIAMFYFYFAFGPVINLLLGGEIYFGTVRQYIPEACIIFMLGLTGIFVVSILVKPKLNLSEEVINSTRTHYFALTGVLLLLIAYQLFVFVYFGPSVIGLSKVKQIQIIGAGLHYNFLLGQLFIMSFYFFSRATKANRRLYLVNAIFYTCYCVLFQERDFIFLFFSIALHRHLLKPFRLNRFGTTFRLTMLVALFVMISAFIISLRLDNSASAFGFESILNQGNLLFINTQILDITRNYQPFLYGETYLNSIINVVPGIAYRADLQLLSWFKQIYAPASESGYGFALDAEAYLNFAYWGVIPFFILVSLIQRFIYNRIGKQPFYLYFSVFYTAFLMYSFRNDSLALIKGSVYAIFFFFVIVLASWPAVRIHETRDNNRTTLQPHT